MEKSTLSSRILGIDYGKKYVGVAMSDSLLITAQPLCTIERINPTKQRKLLAKIAEICNEHGVDSIVIGLPKNLDGTENVRCEFTYEFANLLFKRVNIPIYLWDERLTTTASDRELDFLGVADRNKKNFSDEMAAVFILQGYLNSIKNNVDIKPYLSWEDSMEKANFVDTEGVEDSFYVLMDTVVNETVYLLASEEDPEEVDECECFILNEVSDSEDECVYEEVLDEEEFQSISKIFDELLEEEDIDLSK